MIDRPHEAAPKFSLGRVVATPGALAALSAAAANPAHLLERHVTGDWGTLDADDAAQNDRAVVSGQDRLFSAYVLEGGTRVWVITEWDRSVTTLLLPEEY